MFIKNKLNKLNILLISILFILILLKSYSGNYHSMYLHLWQYKLGLASFKNDFYLKNTILDQVSIMYNVFSFLRVDLDNDYVGFFLHSIFLSFSAVYTYKIINENFKINKNDTIIILFAITVISNFIILGNKSSWLINHSATPTFFSHTVIPFFLWSLFNKRIFYLFLSTIFMLLVNIKSAWFIVGVGCLFSLFTFKLKNNIWIIGIIIPLIYLIFISPSTNIDEETKKFFFKSALERESFQAAFHLQPLYRLIILTISFLIFYFLIKKIDAKNKSFLYILLFFSIIIFLFFYCFAKFGYIYFPETRLLALSGTRALGMYEFFFFILLFVYIFQSRLSKLNKTLASFLIFFILIKSLFPFLLALLITIFITVISKTVKNNFIQSILKYDLLFLILILPAWSYLALYKTNYDFYALKKINKWTTGTLYYDKKRLDNAIKLRECEDFKILDIKHPFIFSSISRKSNFVGDQAFNYFNKEVIIKSKESKKILQILKNKKKNSEQIENIVLKKLYDERVILIIENEFLDSFNLEIDRYNLKNGDFLLIFLPKEELKNFKSNCLAKINSYNKI